MMDDIVSKVSVFGGHAVNVEIRRCTFEQYEAQWTEHDTTVRDPFGKFTGGFEGSFADVNTFFGGLDSLVGEPQKNVVRLVLALGEARPALGQQQRELYSKLTVAPPL